MLRHSLKLLAAASISTGCFASAAAADSGEYYVWGVTPQVWTVKSNGHDYTQMAHQGAVNVQGKLNYDTGTAGRVKSWWAEPEIGEGVYALGGLSAYRKSQSYPVGNRPKTIHPNLFFAIPNQKIETYAVQRCNLHAATLRSQGRSDGQIFSKSYDLTVPVTLKVSVSANGAGAGNAIFEADIDPYEVTIRCARSAPSVLEQPSADLRAPEGGGGKSFAPHQTRSNSRAGTTRLRRN